jgi:hypothetical protein
MIRVSVMRNCSTMIRAPPRISFFEKRRISYAYPIIPQNVLGFKDFKE